MGDLVKKMTSRIFTPDANPESTISITVPRKALKSAVNNSVRKRDWVDRIVNVGTRRRINVEAAEGGTNDSIFFAPESPNVNQSSQRVSATEFIKINPNESNDIVRLREDFEISFIGMSVTTQDCMGDNELLLCSLARKEDCIELNDTGDLSVSAVASSTIESTSSMEDKDAQEREPGATSKETDDIVKVKMPKEDISLLPTALPIRPGDIPFLHYDPVTDGHQKGSEPDTFIPVPGSKRLFLQRKGTSTDSDSSGTHGIRDVVVRFIVMEIDKLSEEQIIAVKSLEEVAKSVSKAANSVPYLKIIAWLLKSATIVGRSALKKVARPDHVMSTDVSFMLAPDDDPSSLTTQHEKYGNYLRYGYYFFLSSTIDAKLYAQTGASSQNVQLLLRRHGYSARTAQINEKEYFPLTGMSYVVLKVTRGCSQYKREERSEMFARHKRSLINHLRKYAGTLGSETAEAPAVDLEKGKEALKKEHNK